MSLGYGTQVNTPSQMASIEALPDGDYVLSASLDNGTFGETPKLNWQQSVVDFSNGTGAGSHQSRMCFVNFEANGKMICTLDHLFLMPSGKLKRADILMNRGTDWLVNSQGGEVAVNGVSIGKYEGGVHAIATGVKFHNTLNGHLLNTNGVISGDFILLTYFAQLKEHGLIEE